MYKILQIYKMYKIFQNVNICLGKKVVIKQLTTFSCFFYDGQVWFCCFTVSLEREGEMTLYHKNPQLCSKHSSCCASAAPVWLLEDIICEAPRQTPRLSYIDSSSSSFTSSWPGLVPLRNTRLPWQEVLGQGGRVNTYLLLMLKSWIQTLVGGVRIQRTTPAGVRVEKRKDEASGD